MKLVAAVVTLLSVYACSLQLNDPDPLFWIGLYGLAAVMSAMVVIGRPTLRVSVVAAGIYLLTAILWIEALPATNIDMFRRVHMMGSEEEVRELWGAILCLFWSLCVWLHARRLASAAQTRDARPEENSGRT